MSGESGANPNSEASQRFQEKFNFYVVGLTFTILGLSVQTANTGRNPAADSLEILSWVLLLTSGFLGVKRLQDIPYLLDMYGKRQEQQAKRDKAHVLLLQGQESYTDTDSGATRPMSELVRVGDSNIKVFGEQIEKVRRSMSGRYTWQTRTGFAGLSLLLAGRAYIPVVRIITAVITHNWSSFF